MAKAKDRSQAHVIGRQRFVIQLNERGEAKGVQDSISDLAKQELLRRMDVLFSELAPPDQLIRIEQLQLDIGAIPADNFTEEVIQRVLQELRKKLPRILQQALEKHKELPPDVKHYELLEYFFIHGHYPWWAPRSINNTPEYLFRQQLTTQPQRLRKLLGGLIHKRSALNRLRFQFSEKLLRELNAQLYTPRWSVLQQDLDLLLSLYRSLPFKSPTPLRLPAHTFLVLATKLILSGKTQRRPAEQLLPLLLEELAILQAVPSPALHSHFLRVLSSTTHRHPATWPAPQLARIRKQLMVGAKKISPPAPDEAAISLQQVLDYLRTGKRPTSGKLRTPQALERQIMAWLQEKDDTFQNTLQQLLSDQSTNQRLHQTLQWPTLLAIHEWTWGTAWPTVTQYLTDFDRILDALDTPPFTTDHLHRTLLKDLLFARMHSPGPSGDPNGLSVRFWKASIHKTLLQLARETGTSFQVYFQKAKPTLEQTSWLSDLPELLTELQNEKLADPFAAEVPAKAIAAFQFYLERGYLPTSYPGNSRKTLEEDLYQKAVAGSTALFNMLGQVLRQRQAYTRFRREVSFKLLYVLAFQLAQAQVTDLSNTASPLLPFLPEILTAWLAAQTPDGATTPTTKPTSANDQAGEAATQPLANRQKAPAPKPAVQLPLHLRPRPEAPAVPPTASLSTRQFFFAHLDVLVPKEEAWPHLSSEQFLRHSYAFLVRQSALAPQAITLTALVKQWAQDLQTATATTWRTVASYLKTTAEQQAQLPENLRNVFSILSPPTATGEAARMPQANEVPPAIPPAQPSPPKLPAAVIKWARWLSLPAPTNDQPKPPSTTSFKKLLAPSPTDRELLTAELQHKKIYPDQVLTPIATKDVTRFTDQLAATLDGGSSDELITLRRQLVQAKVYASTTEANEQVNRYALLLLLGERAVAPREATNFFKRLLAWVAKEHQQTTPKLAGQLLADGQASKTPVTLRRLLERIRAQVAPATIKKIKDETFREQAVASRQDRPQRSGQFYRSALFFLLNHGASPWWEPGQLTTEQLFVRASKNDTKALVQLLAQRPRLARQLFPFLTEATLRGFFAQIFPNYVGFIEAWTAILLQLQGQQILPAPLGATTAWMPTWSFALSQQPFASTRFVREGLKTAQAHYGVAPAQLLPLLRTAVAAEVALQRVQYYRLAAILEELDNAALPKVGQVGSSPRATDEQEPEVVTQAKSITEAPRLPDAPANADQADVAESAKLPADAPPSEKAPMTEATTSTENLQQLTTPAEAPLAKQEPLDDLPKPPPQTSATAEPLANDRQASEQKDAPTASTAPPTGDTSGDSATAKSSFATETSAQDSPSTYAEELAEDIRYLRHFFFYGTPPAGQVSRSRAALLALQERLINVHPDLAQTIYRAVLSDRIARDRLYHFFPEALLEKILRLRLERQLASVQRLWADLAQLLPGTVRTFRKAEFRTWAITQLLDFPAVAAASPDLATYPEYLLRGIARRNGRTLEKIFLELTEALKHPPSGLQGNWPELLVQLRAQKTQQFTNTEEATSADQLHPMEETIYVHNAGLVIMAPFFNRYFNRLGMLDGQAFKDEATAIRGVLLLEYLASGRTEVPEHELVFNKVLCGLPLATPVPATIELTEEEEALSGQLLNAVLQNWEKMSNSTVENLRGAFILRQGLLREHAEHWSLQVDKAGFDIILTFLPWTISILSLPWMAKRIETNWPTNA